MRRRRKVVPAVVSVGYNEKVIKYLSKVKINQIRGVALLRLDFNTDDDWRMRAVLPTIKFLLKRSLKLVILSHRGRPEGFDKKFSLRNNGVALQRLIGRRVRFVPSLDFRIIREAIDRSPRGSIILLENLRFWKEEEANDRRFAKQLASLAGDFYPHTKRGHTSSTQDSKSPRCGVGVYVNDAFAVSHRANASVVAITKFLPSYAGLELEREIKFLSGVTKKPARPVVLVLGGGKAADKLGVIRYFKNKADSILLGGAAANTILRLRGADMGRSLLDKNKRDLKSLREVLRYENAVLPMDLRWHKGAALDIGKRTVEVFSKKLSRARTIIWSGPMGYFEKRGFGVGNLAVARAIARNRKAFTLAGGGETVAFLKKHKLDEKFGFISTGGGAMLDFLAGKKLPGLEALK